MRDKNEMFKLIKDTALGDDRIRAALLCGSRADRAAQQDRYQDYDVVYVITETEPFYDNKDWLEMHFGTVLIMQQPEKMTLIPPEGDGRYIYLAIFEDGVRVDLCFCTSYDASSEPSVVLVDKDGIYQDAPVGKSYWLIERPTQTLFSDCSNEFWWCLNNAAKGIMRDEVPYVMRMLNEAVRDMLDQMTCWYIGCKNGFSVSAGKMGKYFKRYLPENLYRSYLKTYPGTGADELWRGLYAMCDLFSGLAAEVSAELGLVYNSEEETAMRNYLDGIRSGIY